MLVRLHGSTFEGDVTMLRPIRCLSVCVILALASLSGPALAADKAKAESAMPKGALAPVATPVQVSGAWIRATVKGQSGTGGFMQLLSTQALTLTGFASEVAGSTELHDMKMDGNVMRMRPIESLSLPPGQTVSLRPGGHHLMLMSLKQVLKEGDAVAITLLLKSEDGKVIRQEVMVPVKAQAPMGMGMGASAPHQGMSPESGMIKSMAF